MSTELLASALNALRRLAEKAGTPLVEVRLVVGDRSHAERLADVLQPSEERSAGPVGDVVSSMEAIQLWESGTDLPQSRDLGGTLGDVRWLIDWQRTGGPSD
jgi:hypothetical protein